MKIPRMANSVGYIDDDLVCAATEGKKKNRHNPWFKWGATVACFALILAASIVILPKTLSVDEPAPPIAPVTSDTSRNEGTSDESAGGENALEKYYTYEIDDGKFSAYIGGKVIAEEKLGNKTGNVTVTAGWKNGRDEWISTEKLNAEVYALDGISEDVAVALRFIDQGEAITTARYYVILNPDADLSAVEDYVIKSVNTKSADFRTKSADLLIYQKILNSV